MANLNRIERALNIYGSGALPWIRKGEYGCARAELGKALWCLENAGIDSAQNYTFGVFLNRIHRLMIVWMTGWRESMNIQSRVMLNK
ncbi:MAG: hypothetical protein HY518_05245 [Candidatus Aenigmarchaeota archaeon]|nr:hypothetical protein [Candidatus Aenigmarchaeota archaeon]